MFICRGEAGPCDMIDILLKWILKYIDERYLRFDIQKNYMIKSNPQPNFVKNPFIQLIFMEKLDNQLFDNIIHQIPTILSKSYKHIKIKQKQIKLLFAKQKFITQVIDAIIRFIFYIIQNQQSMHNDDIKRKTFMALNNKSPIKKKVSRLVKLPSVRQVQQQTGGYILGELLGEGGFGKVRLCKKKIDNSEAVMKIYQKFKLINEQKRKDVMREIDIMKCIRHPNIIRILDYFENVESINIVMQHFSRTTLTAYAKKNRPLSDGSLRSIVRQIAEAVAYLHRMKIAHRDLKPENVLINQNGEIKLIDMGLSMMGDYSEVKIGGTPYYMSPELVLKKQYNPYRSDVWAFGILVYWLVLGYFPQDNQINKKHKNYSKFDLKFPADMHPGIEYLISKMLELQPAQRIQAQQILSNTWIQPKDFKSEISKLMKNIAK